MIINRDKFQQNNAGEIYYSWSLFEVNYRLSYVIQKSKYSRQKLGIMIYFITRNQAFCREF